MQGAQFLAVATIVVYAGAILVTFLFVLMLAQSRGQAEPPDPGRVTFPEGHYGHPEPPSAGNKTRQIVAFPERSHG